jgi:hypothetical protein
MTCGVCVRTGLVFEGHILPQVICRTAHIEIFGVKLSVFGEIEVFLGHEHSLTEEILVDLLAVGSGDEPLIPLDWSLMTWR